MSVIENKATVQRLVDEGWNARQLETFDAVLAPGFHNHDPNNLAAADADGLKRFVQSVWNGFPDFHVEITDAIAEENTVAKCWVARGTQQGVFMGIPATGKHVDFDGVSVYHLAGGKIESISWSYNMLGLLQQLGVVPALGAEPA
jgi:steroid delta-isomerase-like uncharacterized protein